MAETPPAGVSDASEYDFNWYAQGWRANVSSDAEVFRKKDRYAAGARETSRRTAYGASIRRTLVDNLVGARLNLIVEINADALGITPEAASALVGEIEREWTAVAENSFALDAQRMQTFSGLMRTAISSYVTAGETLGSVEWKEHPTGYATCLHLHDPDRLTDPNFSIDPLSGRRMGVERDQFGEPVAYHLRRSLPSDGLWRPADSYLWDRFERYTSWGRPRILHAFEHDRPDMTRGYSSFASVIEPLKNLSDYLETERAASAVRAEFAGVISAEINYDQAMTVLGANEQMEAKKKGVANFGLDYAAKKSPFYKAQNISLGRAKIIHLLPNEKMEFLHATQAVGSLKEASDVHLYEIASGAGVDYSTLTKNYTQTSYSGGRQALAENSRSYEVRRDDFLTQFAEPFAKAWLEEAIVVRGTITLPGKLGYYEASKYIRLTFETWGKALLDPLKEVNAHVELYKIGGTNLREICKEFNKDWREVLKQRALEKGMMESLGLKPEDINWDLIAGVMKAKQPKPQPDNTNE